MHLARTWVCGASLLLCACVAPHREAANLHDRLLVEGGYDAPGDADHLYFKHATPDGQAVTLSVVELPRGWRAAPRVEGEAGVRLAEAAELVPRDWQQVEPPPARREDRPSWKARLDLHCVKWDSAREVYARQTSPALLSDGYHTQRGLGRPVYFTELGPAEDPNRTRIEVYGGDGWPLTWVHIGGFELATPALSAPDRWDAFLPEPVRVVLYSVGEHAGGLR